MSKFTYLYSQPQEYQFSLDSVELPLRVSERIQDEASGLGKSYQVLDLCAGCGVVGFELHYHLPGITRLDFLEVQDIYHQHYLANLEMVQQGPRGDRGTAFSFHQLNYQDVLIPSWEGVYDLVISNPPYFEPDQGRLSPSEFKNRCRFFLDSDFATLCRVLVHVLKPAGEAYFLLRPLQDHKKDLLAQLQRLVLIRAKVEVLDSIRGTDLVRVVKNKS